MSKMVAALGLVGCAACGDPSSAEDGVSLLAREAPDSTVAYRDGGGPWTVLTADANGRYAAAEPAHKYEFIVLCTVGMQPLVTVYQATIDELSSITHVDECRSSLVPITGSASGLTAMGARLGIGPQHGVGTGNGPFAFEAPPGVRDFVGIRVVAIQPVSSDAVLLVRDVTVAAGTVVQADFASSVPLEQHAVAGVSYSDRATTHVTSKFVTRNGTMPITETSQSILLFAGDALEFQTVSASAMMPGDLNIVSFYDSSGGVANPLYRSQITAAASVSDMPPEFLDITSPNVELTSLNPPALSWPGAPALEAYAATIGTAGMLGSSPAGWRLHTTRAFLDGVSDLVLAVPDASELPGWPIVPSTGRVRFSYSLRANTGADIDQLLQSSPTKETVIRTTGRSGEGEVALVE